MRVPLEIDLEAEVSHYYAGQSGGIGYYSERGRTCSPPDPEEIEYAVYLPAEKVRVHSDGRVEYLLDGDEALDVVAELLAERRRVA